MQAFRLSRKSYFANASLLIIFLTFLFVQSALCEDTEQTNTVLLSRVFRYKHITSRQAQEMLSQLNIGVGYNPLNNDVLIVTSNDSSDLTKATGFFNLAEQVPSPQIRVLLSDIQSPVFSLDEFVRSLDTLSVGTLTDAPPVGSDNPVILDIAGGGRLVAIADSKVLDTLETSLAEYLTQHQSIEQNTGQVTESPAEPETQTAPKPTLEDIAEEVFSDSAITELPVIEEVQQEQGVSEPAPDETPAEESVTAEEDYFSDELLKAVLDAQQDIEQQKQTAQVSQPQPEVSATETPVEPAPDIQPEPAREPEQNDDPLAVLRAMLAAQGLLGDETVPDPVSPQQTEEIPAVAAETPTEPESQIDPVMLMAKLEALSKEMAEMKAQAAGKEPTATEPSVSKAQTSGIVRTTPELNPQVAETELETITMDLPQEVELESLVDLVGKQLGLNYMYDPALLRNQKVQLMINGGKIKVKDVYSLLESVMKLKGFVMTRRDELVTIVKAADFVTTIRQIDTVIRTPGEPIEAGDVVVSTIFQLKNVPTATAKQMLTSLNLGMNNGFQEVAETGTLIVTDYAYRMERIEKVLSIIDVPSEGREYKLRTLVYLKPSDLVPKLKDLAGKLQGVTLQVGTSASAAPTATRTVTRRNPTTGETERVEVPVTTTAAATAAAASAQPKADPDAVYIDTDDRTNRILIAGDPDDITLVNELIDVLDVPQYDLKTVREYIIQFVEATDVVNVLNELGLAKVSVSTPSGGTSARATAPGAGATVSTQTGSEQPYVSIRPATNSLLVNATNEQHKAIELVIAHIDVVQKDQRTIKQYEIQFVDTQEIIDTLTDLGIIISGSASSGSSQQTASRTSARTAPRATPTPAPTAGGVEGVAVPVSLPTAEGGSERELTMDQPQISVLETTNSLLVYATPRQHNAIALVIAHADRQLDRTSTPYVVYALENQNPTDLAAVLTDTVQQTIDAVSASRTTTSRVGTSTTAAAAAASTTPTLPTLEEQDIKIIADEPSYSLIVYANKRNQQWIADLIKELDEYRPQVLLDCTLVEVTQDEKFEYDLDIITKTFTGTDMRSGQIGTLEDFSTSQYGEARSTTSAEPLFKAFFDSGHVQALLTAIQTQGYGRVMARPKILVNDNQEGEIKTENTISVAQLKSNIVPTSTGTASTAVTTTDVTFNDYNAGVTLAIKPHISKGDMLRLEITLNRTDFTLNEPISLTDGGATRQFPSPPDRLSTDVTTVSTVPDGTTIILGGLETINQSKGNSKVPILGDLPVIGSLFRGVTDIGEQSKLYVFVKANILRPGDQAGGLEDIRRVSAENRRSFEKMEKQFQELQDIPWIDPKPMDSEKVLEDD